MGHAGCLRSFAVIWVVSACLASTASAASPPPGATAQCRDGTYSYSQHHSGTCSHHGGVATWLDGSTTTAATPGVGSTVDLGPVTRTRGCAPGALPDRRCSPGAFYSALTATVICAPGFRTGSIRNVTDSERHAVEVEYGLTPRAYGSTLEIDHIVPLELGGSNAIANLFPERATGFHAKDRLENALRARVCARTVSLAAARKEIAVNWKASYTRTFG